LTLNVGQSVTCDLTHNVGHCLSLVTWHPTEYYHHLVSSDEWQIIINIVCQVTSDRLEPTFNIQSLVTWHPMVGNSLSLVTWHTMFVIICQSWRDVRNIVCQVTSDRLEPTLSVKWRVKAYYQHLVSSHEWQTMTNIGCQVLSVTRHLTADVGNIQSLVTWHPMVGNSLSLVTWPTMFVIICHSLLPTSGVKSWVTDYDQHWVSSDEWQTMTNIRCQVTCDRLSWHQMMVIFSHSWLDTRCLS
jgi:hypothetical protein